MSLRTIVFPLVEYLGADDSRRWPSLASYTSIVLATPQRARIERFGPAFGACRKPGGQKGPNMSTVTSLVAAKWPQKSVPEAKSASIFVLQSRDRAPNKAILLLWTGKSMLLIW